MAKLMLVEDDNNLREIYEARLQAEGYTIVSARDGEEALVVAKAEKPDLIISDVMMPKISGFEMLDILRNTDGLKNLKIIMLTALGQSDDQQRADRLGADRYLVKSQVTLEDIVKVAHELLADTPAPAPSPESPALPVAPATDTATPAAPSSSDPVTPASAPPAVADEPAAATAPSIDAPAASSDQAQPATQEEATMKAQIEDFVAGTSQAPVADAPAPPPQPAAAAAPAAKVEAVEPEPAGVSGSAPAKNKAADSNPVAHKKVITPLPEDPKTDLSTLLALEEAKQAIAQGPPPPTAIISTNEAGITAVPLAAPATDNSQVPVAPSGTAITPTVEPSDDTPGEVIPLPGGKVDPSSIAL